MQKGSVYVSTGSGLVLIFRVMWFSFPKQLNQVVSLALVNI